MSLSSVRSYPSMLRYVATWKILSCHLQNRNASHPSCQPGVHALLNIAPRSACCRPHAALPKAHFHRIPCQIRSNDLIQIFRPPSWETGSLGTDSVHPGDTTFSVIYPCVYAASFSSLAFLSACETQGSSPSSQSGFDFNALAISA